MSGEPRTDEPKPLVHLVRDSAGEARGALVLLHGRGADTSFPALP